jgi:hypothetical protein
MSKPWLKRILEIVGTLALMVLTVVVYPGQWLQGLRPLDSVDGYRRG